MDAAPTNKPVGCRVRFDSLKRSSDMAFLRQCLQEARRRFGDLDSCAELAESVGGIDDYLHNRMPEQSWYPMSLAALQGRRNRGSLLPGRTARSRDR